MTQNDKKHIYRDAQYDICLVLQVALMEKNEDSPLCIYRGTVDQIAGVALAGNPDAMAVYRMRYMDKLDYKHIAEKIGYRIDRIGRIITKVIVPTLLQYKNLFSIEPDVLRKKDIKPEYMYSAEEKQVSLQNQTKANVMYWSKNSIPLERTYMEFAVIKKLRPAKVFMDDGTYVVRDIQTVDDLADLYIENGRRFPQIAGLGKTGWYQCLKIAASSKKAVEYAEREKAEAKAAERRRPVINWIS